MHTFSFIASYKDFFTISQHQGHTPVEGIENWQKTFPFDLLPLSEHEKATLRSDVSAGPVRKDDQFKSVWFVTSGLGKKEPILDGVFSIHILDTRLG